MISHNNFRETFTWHANLEPPHREYLMKDLATPHIVNIIKNVEHLKDIHKFHFLLELEGRQRGIYEDIKEYDED